MPPYCRRIRSAGGPLLLLAVGLFQLATLRDAVFLAPTPRVRLGDRGRVALGALVFDTLDGRQVVECPDEDWGEEDWGEKEEPVGTSVPASCLKCTGTVCQAQLEEQKSALSEDDARLLRAFASTIEDEELRDLMVMDFLRSKVGDEQAEEQRDELRETYHLLQAEVEVAV